MGGGGIGISGSLTTSSMRKVLEFLCKKLGLGTSSVFMDAGCALGRWDSWPLALRNCSTFQEVEHCVGVNSWLRSIDVFPHQGSAPNTFPRQCSHVAYLPVAWFWGPSTSPWL